MHHKKSNFHGLVWSKSVIIRPVVRRKLKIKRQFIRSPLPSDISEQGVKQSPADYSPAAKKQIIIHIYHTITPLQTVCRCTFMIAVNNPLFFGNHFAQLWQINILGRFHPTRLPIKPVNMQHRQLKQSTELKRQSRVSDIAVAYNTNPLIFCRFFLT